MIKPAKTEMIATCFACGCEVEYGYFTAFGQTTISGDGEGTCLGADVRLCPTCADQMKLRPIPKRKSESEKAFAKWEKAYLRDGSPGMSVWFGDTTFAELNWSRHEPRTLCREHAAKATSTHCSPIPLTPMGKAKVAPY